jgi:ABC-type lipopolysaccharide export system ATPase subunit
MARAISKISSAASGAERHKALEDAARLRHEHLTGIHHTPEGFHALLEARKAGVAKLSVSDIADLQLSLKNKGFPVKVTGELSDELIIIAKAYLKAHGG